MTELKLKKMGFNSWQDCVDKKKELPFKEKKLADFLEQIEAGLKAVEADDIGYLVGRFPKKEQWRILAAYYKNATYFDIETTGLNFMNSHITVISAYRRGKVYSFNYDENLDGFLDLIEDSSLLISFNGSSFDVPFLEKTFHIPELSRPHIDLRWISYHAGFKSGLKEIEKKLGIQRPADLCEIDGFEAVMLYYRKTRGDIEAGKKLVKYCCADAVSTYLVSLQILKNYGIDTPAAELNIERLLSE